MHHLDMHKEHVRRYYYEQKEKIEFHRQLYEKYGGEREYYKNLYKSLVKPTTKETSDSSRSSSHAKTDKGSVSNGV